MNPSARRRHLSLFLFLVAFLCLVGANPDLEGQPKTDSKTPSREPLDATYLREPLEIGTLGLVQAGDDPAWAHPDFDDSKWLPVDANTRASDYFPDKHTPVIWRRLHLKVSTADQGLALQAYIISRAFEIYVNGQKLMELGQVEPFVPYTRGARMIVRIPEEQLRTGTLLIAIRARAPRVWWKSTDPAFRGNMLTLGGESALRNQNLLIIIGENATDVLESLVALGVGLVALALFIAQRNRSEYLWIFLLGTWEALELATSATAIYNLPVSWSSLFGLMYVAEGLGFLLVFQAFLRQRFNRALWLFAVVALLIRSALQAAYVYENLPAIFGDFAWLPFGIVIGVILPCLVWRQMRRGNREARILLVPLFLYSVQFYVLFSFNVLVRIPPLHTASDALLMLLSLRIGIFRLGLDSINGLAFLFSLAIIMVLRFARASRQQAVLESEMAAARQVQQIIVPEEIEAVPGFTVESLYQPAQQVGGDFFQILPTHDGGLLVVVGDVAGKGLPAAMLVSVLVGAIRGVAEYTKDPAELIANLNERLVGRGGSLSTALVAHISASGEVTIANAGHLSPYLDGREVELPGALPLGVLSGAVYDATQFTLAPGTRLTFYSDGVIEAQNSKGELFGFDRAQAISKQPAADIVRAAQQFGQEDDITVVTIERHLPIAAVA